MERPRAAPARRGRTCLALRQGRPTRSAASCKHHIRAWTRAERRVRSLQHRGRVAQLEQGVPDAIDVVSTRPGLRAGLEFRGSTTLCSRRRARACALSAAGPCSRHLCAPRAAFGLGECRASVCGVGRRLANGDGWGSSVLITTGNGFSLRQDEVRNDRRRRKQSDTRGTGRACRDPGSCTSLAGVLT